MIELVQKIANFKIEEEEFESRRCPFTEARIGNFFQTLVPSS